MDQIYYTQCPVGYGLGASGGLQIKRIDDGYPMSSDLRHLGLRAYIGSGRSLAPRTLRYRRDGDVAEVAALTPREKEYQTERGLWGRPGGHFAHGLRLTPSELAAIENWPAGLLDWPAWRRDDPGPSHGEPPEPLAEGWPGRFDRPAFAAISARARDLDAGPETIAGLLTALAESVRADRCVFLIDEAPRLAEWIALLTFAIPGAIRPALTFSTYHDRPEELPGFRLHGTVPAARPNRSSLAGLGFVADLAGKAAIDPPIVPASWSRTLADWVVRGDADSAAAWERVGSLIARSIEGGSVAGSGPWADDWLDRIVGFEEALRSSGPPGDAEGWSNLSGLASWSGSMGLAEDWLARRPAPWWRDQIASAAFLEARAAARVHAALKPSADWAATAAAWHRSAGEDEQVSAIRAILRGAEGPDRGAFLASFVRGLPEEAGDAILDRLSGDPIAPEAIRLPLEARRSVAKAAAGGDRRPVQDLLERAFAIPEAIRATLGAVESELAIRPEAGPSAARALADLVPRSRPEAVKVAFAWTLGLAPDRASAWLSAYLRLVLAHPDHQGFLRSIWARTAAPLKPSLAVAILSAARDPNLGREPFPWAVETLLLDLPAEARPADPAWPSAYLRRTPSGYDLSHKLYLRATRNPELRRWIDGAIKAGWLDDDQRSQLDRCRSFARVLASGDARALRGLDVPNVPPGDRGRLLGEMIRAVGGAAFEGVDFCLDAARAAWPDAFRPGAPGLASLAAPLAESLGTFRPDPGLWFDRLGRVLERLGAGGFGPDTLAAEIVAEAARIGPESAEVWRLREFLLGRDDAWRALSADARRDVAGPDPAENLARFRRWDAGLTRNARLMEVLLNACPPETLARVVPASADGLSETRWADELKAIGLISWWDRPSGAVDDIRDRFAREVPLAPLDPDALWSLRRWLGGDPRPPRTIEPDDEPDFAPIDPTPVRTPEKAASAGPLSGLGEARWAVLIALTASSRPGIDAEGRWRQLVDWARNDLPIGRLGVEDRRRAVAWLILRAERWDDRDLPDLASWLIRQGLDSAEEIGRWKTWTRDLDGLAPAADLDSARVLRIGFVGALRDALRSESAAQGRGMA